MIACVALLNMAAQCSGATELDRAHHPALQAAERSRVRLPVRVAVAVEDIRHFVPDGRHGAQALGFTGKASVNRGSRSNGLVVAHKVLVATFK